MLHNRELDGGYAGQRWLVEERDACGVGFIADQQGRASHDLVTKALTAATCMEHRGGCSADQDSGDGAGIMTAIPWELLGQWLQTQGMTLPPDQIGVGMVFLPPATADAQAARKIVEGVLAETNLRLLGWRTVPVKPEVLGVQAKQNQPQIEQLLVHSATLQGEELERYLYWTRKRIEQAIRAALPQTPGLQDFYICSFSHRTIVYKGMVRSEVLGQFYEDLTNPAYQSEFAVYHRRFSTNTMPKWPLAQPMRFLGHNGEINTLLGNINWMMAREADLAHSLWGDRLSDLKPVVNSEQSDSANLDSVIELLVQSGRAPLEATMILVPEAYLNQPDLANYPEIVDFYEYYSGVQEPWDGPALLAFSDGKIVGATLDRNGLRPARYCITRDGFVVVGSEAGVVDLPESEIVEKGRLGPGQAIAVDLENHEILRNWQIKQRIASQHPYGTWLQNQRETLEPQQFPDATTLDVATLLQQQTAFGYTTEDVEMIIEDMAATGKEPTFCMGDDIPLAVLSDKPRLLYDYFKQRFAQVTNPPIDPLRESLVMSLTTQLGGRGNLLEVKPESAHLLKLTSPVLNEVELEQIKQSSFDHATLSTLFRIADGPDGLQYAVNVLCQQATAAVREGKKILILSDRVSATGESAILSQDYSYIPPMLAVGAVHHHLIRQGLR
ncbi:MAG TPA: glutamate synthase central domain-containing protein, partial [Allocoleopsis sp.]